MLNGVVACQAPGGTMVNELLATHAALQEDATAGERGRERFARSLNLNRLQDAWEVEPATAPQSPRGAPG